MYESRNEPVLASRQFALRVLRHIGLAFLLIVMALSLGTIGHLWFEPVAWHDALLNVSFMLAGLGPFMLPASISGKMFFAFYNVIVGLVFVALLGVVMAPILHRIIHKFHLDDD